MNILLTIHHYLDPNAGAPAVTLKTAQNYRNLGQSVDCFSFDHLPKKLPEGAKGFLFPQFVAKHIHSVERSHPLDIVEASTGDAWVWGFLKRRCKLPILAIQSHGLEHICHLERLTEAKKGNLHLSWKYPLYHGGFRLWEVAQSLRAADVVFMLNQRDVDYAVEEIGLDKNCVHVCAHGLPEHFQGIRLQSSLSQSHCLSIAQVGSYIKRKGIDYAIPAFVKILKKFPSIKLSLIGTNCPEKRVYKDFPEQLHHRIQVIPHYQNDCLPTLLKKHQIKVLASLSEGFGLTLLEAMACGLAPIASRVQGPSEIIDDGKNGILIPLRNTSAIVHALESLILNPEKLYQLQVAAHRSAQSYQWDVIAKQRLEIYRDILKNR